MTEREFRRLGRGSVVCSPGGRFRIVLLGPKDERYNDKPVNKYACHFAKITRGRFFDADHGHGVTTLYYAGEMIRGGWTIPERLTARAYRELVKIERHRLKRLGCKNIAVMFRALTKQRSFRCKSPSRSYWPAKQI